MALNFSEHLPTRTIDAPDQSALKMYPNTHKGMEMNHLIRNITEIKAKTNVAISTETIPYILRIAQNSTAREIPFLITQCVQAIENKNWGWMQSIHPSTIGEMLCIMWANDPEDSFSILEHIWQLAEEIGVNMSDVYKATPELIEQMCLSEVALDSRSNVFRQARLHQLVEQCVDTLSIKHYKQIEKLASKTMDKNLLVLLGQIRP